MNVIKFTILWIISWWRNLMDWIAWKAISVSLKRLRLSDTNYKTLLFLVEPTFLTCFFLLLFLQLFPLPKVASFHTSHSSHSLLPTTVTFSFILFFLKEHKFHLESHPSLFLYFPFCPFFDYNHWFLFYFFSHLLKVREYQWQHLSHSFTLSHSLTHSLSISLYHFD